jgi:CcmD family protein
MLRNYFNKIFLALTILLGGFQSVIAQDTSVEMATGLRSNGKIYVVVLVLCIVFIGIIIYLVGIDKKVTKLEKELKK